MKRPRHSPELALLCAVLILAAVGCGHAGDGKLAAIKQALKSQGDIVSRSGGDWNSLSPADQQALINGPGAGNVTAAKQYLAVAYARAHAPMAPGPERPAPAPSNSKG